MKNKHIALNPRCAFPFNIRSHKDLRSFRLREMKISEIVWILLLFSCMGSAAPGWCLACLGFKVVAWIWPHTLLSLMALSKVILSPACSTQELVLHLCDKHPSLAKDPLRRPWATKDAIEVFGQSPSFREGFRARELRCASFDIRCLTCNMLDSIFSACWKGQKWEVAATLK